MRCRSWWLSDRYNSRTRSDEDGAAADEPGSDAEGATGRGYWAAGCKNGGERYGRSWQAPHGEPRCAPTQHMAHTRALIPTPCLSHRPPCPSPPRIILASRSVLRVWFRRPRRRRSLPLGPLPRLLRPRVGRRGGLRQPRLVHRQNALQAFRGHLPRRPRRGQARLGPRGAMGQDAYLAGPHRSHSPTCPVYPWHSSAMPMTLTHTVVSHGHHRHCCPPSSHRPFPSPPPAVLTRATPRNCPT